MNDQRSSDDLCAEAFAKSLIRAARREVPSGAAHRRALTALTSGAVLGAASALTSVASAASKTSLTSLLALPVGIKWGAAGILACSVAAGAATVAHERTAASAQLSPGITSSQNVQRAVGRVAAVSDRPVPAEPREPVREISIASPPERRSTLERRARIPASIASADQLAAEAAELREARAELDARDARAALAALDRYRARWPRGRLGLEASVLRIEALALAGQSGPARSLAEEFLKRHPRTPFARRVRQLTGIGDDEPGAH